MPTQRSFTVRMGPNLFVTKPSNRRFKSRNKDKIAELMEEVNNL